MSFFNPKEFGNIKVRAKRDPSLALKMAFDLGLIISSRILQSVVRKRVADAHHAGRIRPGFLGMLEKDTATEQKGILLPAFHRKNENKWQPPRCADKHGASDDIENYYFQHRWSECISAMWSDNTAEQALNRVYTWIDEHVDDQQPEWEPYSSSERVANLAALLMVHPTLVRDTGVEKLRAFFANSLYWIDAHLENYPGERTNNHILNNARAMVIAGSVLGSTSAVETGVHLFTQMAAKLISPKGFLRERSSHYQIVIANWFMDTILFAKPYAERSAAIARNLLELESVAGRVNEAAAVIVAGTKQLQANIGDISPDVCPAVSLARLQFLHGFAQTADIPKGIDIADGWFFMQDSTQSIIGNTPYPKFPVAHPTHGHNDLGSFIWAIDGRIVLSDPGRFRYTKDAVSLEQIVGRGHNCVVIDGFSPLAEPLNVNGGWNPDYYASAKISVSATSNHELVLKHTGFSRITSVKEHTRTIRLGERTMTVEDHISGSAGHLVEQYWHFSPGAVVEIEKDKAFVHIANRKISCLPSVTNGNGSIQVLDYASSQQYGTSVVGKKILVSTEVQLPVTIKTTFSY